MTTTFTASPMKITTSTARIFFGGGMLGSFMMHGRFRNKDYPSAPSASITAHRNRVSSRRAEND